MFSRIRNGINRLNYGFYFKIGRIGVDCWGITRTSRLDVIFAYFQYLRMYLVHDDNLMSLIAHDAIMYLYNYIEKW